MCALQNTTVYINYQTVKIYIYRFFLLPQGNHVAKFVKDSIYRTEVIMFSSVYRIFTKLGHMVPLWKRKNPIYLGVIRSKGKVTVTMNIIFDNRVVSA
jgi:hypothetical protein